MEFGQLKVLELFKIMPTNGMSMWLCRCYCGKSKSVRRDALLNGDTISCGCCRKLIKTTHGLRRTKIYDVWSAMLQRCLNLNNKSYKNYGGRGITVCER